MSDTEDSIQPVDFWQKRCVLNENVLNAVMMLLSSRLPDLTPPLYEIVQSWDAAIEKLEAEYPELLDPDKGMPLELLAAQVDLAKSRLESVRNPQGVEVGDILNLVVGGDTEVTQYEVGSIDEDLSDPHRLKAYVPGGFIFLDANDFTVTKVVPDGS